MINDLIHIPESDIPIKAIRIEEKDLDVLQNVYLRWMELNASIREMGGRPVALPEQFVESVVALKLGYLVVDDIHNGFDCYDLNAELGNRRVEIKYSTGRIDVTSFSPILSWDRLNFVKVYVESAKECYFEVYDISREIILEESETFNRYLYERRGMRPRISINREFIERELYTSKIEFSLF